MNRGPVSLRPDLNAQVFKSIWGYLELDLGASLGPPNTHKYYLAGRPSALWPRSSRAMSRATRERFVSLINPAYFFFLVDLHLWYYGWLVAL